MSEEVGGGGGGMTAGPTAYPGTARGVYFYTNALRHVRSASPTAAVEGAPAQGTQSRVHSVYCSLRLDIWLVSPSKHR